MTGRNIVCFAVTVAAIALVVALASASPATAADDNPQEMRPTVLVGDDLLKIFQAGKDDAEKLDPPENSLGTAFDPQPPQPAPSDYR